VVTFRQVIASLGSPCGFTPTPSFDEMSCNGTDAGSTHVADIPTAAAAAGSAVDEPTAQASYSLADDRPASHRLTEQQLQPLHISMQVSCSACDCDNHVVVVVHLTGHHRISCLPSRKCSRAPSARVLRPRPTCRGTKSALWNTSGQACNILAARASVCGCVCVFVCVF
jgi:hypothetical protein